MAEKPDNPLTSEEILKLDKDAEYANTIETKESELTPEQEYDKKFYQEFDDDEETIELW